MGQGRNRGALSCALGALCPSATITAAGRRVTWAGCREPRLRSRLTAQLARSNSCQPVVSQPGRVCAPCRAASGPSSPNSSGRLSAGLRVPLPTENSPSLVARRPVSWGEVRPRQIGLLKIQGAEPSLRQHRKKKLGREKLPLFALEIRGQGFSFSQAASTPG